MKKLTSFSLVALFYSSCAISDLPSFDSALTSKSKQTQHYQSFHRQVEKLARQLLITSQLIDNSRTAVIGTILPTTQPSGSLLPHETAFGLQIQESLITFSTQTGLKVLEYKTVPAIKFDKQADRILS